MKLLRSSLQIRSCTYDFTKDGGALGVYKTGVVIPSNCLIYQVAVEPVATLIGGGAGFKFKLGYNSQADYFIPETGPAIVSLDRANSYALAPSLYVSTGEEVIFTITSDVITAGSVKFHLLFIDSLY